MEVIRASLDTHQDEADWLRAFGERCGDPIPAANREDLWRLYALSRVSDTLLLGFQPKKRSDEPRRAKADIRSRTIEVSC